MFEDADRDPALVEKGALNFVVVGAGATGTEVAGALAEMIRDVMPSEYHDLAIQRAKVTLVDAGHAVLGPFSPNAHEYASKALERDGVEIRLGVSVKEIGPGHATLSDGTTIPTRCVIWGGGLMAAPLAENSGIAQGRGGRIDVLPDLTVADHPRLYALGDFANVPGPDGKAFPQLGSVALQAGRWAAKNIRADLDGKPRTEFHYHDKGIMAMIGRNAAVAEVGKHRHELHGAIAFAAWLGVHVVLMSGVRQRVDAFVSWAWDYFTKSRGPQVLDRSDVARIDWDDDDGPMAERYDVIIIGTGAGGGTLAHTLAPSGKRILLLERGDFLPREMDNWEPQGGLRRRASTSPRTPGTTPTARPSSRRCTTSSAARRRCTGRRCTGLRPAGLRRAEARRRHLARLAARLRRLRALVHRGRSGCTRSTVRTARIRSRATGASSTRGRRSPTSRGSSSSSTT